MTVHGVPFVDLRRQHQGDSAFMQSMMTHLRSSEFIGGAAVETFERRWAERCEAAYAVGTASGTDALAMALKAIGVGLGDEVIVPAMTFQATYEAIWQLGAIPNPVDITLMDYCIEPLSVRSALTSVVDQYLMPVALYGMPSPVCILSNLYPQLPMVEDACQAHGAILSNRTAAACFSFYPTKNLGALGDAGAVVTNDASIAARVKALRHHGEDGGEHLSIGTTGRLDSIQASFLTAKLGALTRWNQERQQAGLYYEARLYGVADIVTPPLSNPDGRQSVVHLYVIRTEHRDALQMYLETCGVASKIHYPVIPPLTPAFSMLGHEPGAFPNAELLARTGLSLPIFPGITQREQDHVIDAISRFYAHLKART